MCIILLILTMCDYFLQAKLKPHIHDPNAPELIHFKWTILCLLVDACRDPRNGTPDLASKVVSPLLTRDAKGAVTELFNI